VARPTPFTLRPVEPNLTPKAKALTLKALLSDEIIAVLSMPLPKKPTAELLEKSYRLLVQSLEGFFFDRDFATDRDIYSVHDLPAYIDKACTKLKEIATIYPAVKEREADLEAERISKENPGIPF